MAWYEFGAWALGLLLLGLVLWLLFYVVVIAAGIPKALADARRRDRLSTCAETPFGPFFGVPGEGPWQFAGDSLIEIAANDRDGQPDPVFVARLPKILADLNRLDALVRAEIEFDEEADGALKLESVLQSDDDQIVLGYGVPEEDIDAYATLFVTLDGEQVVDSTFVH